MTETSFMVLRTSAAAAVRDEALGTKEKFWVKLDNDDREWLFKEARPDTGEDWAEKLAAEIAGVIGVRAARVELALCDDRRGTVSRSFIDHDANEDLVHGNEILAGQVFGYDPEKKFGQSDHTFQNIRHAICNTFPSSDVYDGILEELASYMVLDALIANVDRHHENWGLVYRFDETEEAVSAFRVAPSFDHASSLGRELLDERMARFLSLSNGVANYINKGRGAIYISSKNKHGENPLRLVEIGSRKYPEYFDNTILKVESVNLARLFRLVDRIPETRISLTGRTFVKELLSHTYGRLCKLTA